MNNSHDDNRQADGDIIITEIKMTLLIAVVAVVLITLFGRTPFFGHWLTLAFTLFSATMIGWIDSPWWAKGFITVTTMTASLVRFNAHFDDGRFVILPPAMTVSILFVFGFGLGRLLGRKWDSDSRG